MASRCAGKIIFEVSPIHDDNHASNNFHLRINAEYHAGLH